MNSALPISTSRPLSIRYTADLLGVTEQRLTSALREMGWVNKDNIPYWETMAGGLMSREVITTGRDRWGNWRQKTIPKMTERGLRAIREEYNEWLS